MTYNEIIKMLECCSKYPKNCRECPLRIPGGCGVINKSEFALDLINRQKAEIDRLSDRNHKCIYLSDEETTEYCVDGPCPKFKTEAQIKSEAIKEFAERLRKKLDGAFCYEDIYRDTKTEINRLIDIVIKELTGETDMSTEGG